MRDVINLIYSLIVLLIGLFIISKFAQALNSLNFGYSIVGLFVALALLMLMKEVLK